ncbi:hypothetical protein [Burkholderia cenocepacia]|uniref:hypothetical protein n=1 Tax=Burkholderia cenocepacia TaxID=95486 RepID=UPI001F24C66D|nr:hypothetical protein [Burkholderia cenocepacia]
MSDPILSREEVQEIAHRICARYVHSENIHLRQYTFGITTLEQLVAAVLEKVCGEPVGILSVHRFRKIDSMVNWDFEYTGSLPDGSHQLYALTRSKP